jgi:type IV pilus assembly protein PilA
MTLETTMNALGTMKKTRRQQGFSLIELLIVVAIILIIAAIAIPNMLASRKAANQASAVSGLRTVTSGAVSYSVTYGNGYPPSMTTLGGLGATATCNVAILIDPVIASSTQKAGYQYGYSGQGGNVVTVPAGCSTPGFNGYLLTAAPISVGLTGNMSYCSTEQGILYFDASGATAGSQGACTALQPVQ